MTQDEENDYLFNFYCTLNGIIQSPFIHMTLCEILKHLNELSTSCINKLISETAYALLYFKLNSDTSDIFVLFLDNLLLHRYGKPNIDSFEFKESAISIINKRLCKFEGYEHKTTKKYMLVLKEIVANKMSGEIVFHEITRRQGAESLEVYYKVMADVRENKRVQE